MRVAHRTIRFNGPAEKAAWLDAAASLDARLPIVRQIAGTIAAARSPNDLEGLAHDLHTFVRDRIHYVRDGVDEEFADAATVLARGWDDCDGKARTFVAMVRAVGAPDGLRARIRPVFNAHPVDPKGEFVHVQAEVSWPGSTKSPLADGHGWLLSELILKDCPLGADPNDLPRGPDGRRVLT